MEHPFTWNHALGIPEKWHHVATSAFVMGVILLLAWLARSALAATTDHGLAPDAKLTPRNFMEVIADAVNGLAESVIGHHSETYVPLMCSFFLFILLCNFVGMIPGFAPPTSNFNITLALGTVSFLAFNYWGFKQQGVGYLKHFVGPIWWLAVLMIPLEIVGALVRPFSLGLRLFGNLFGDHLVLEIFTDLTRVAVPVVFYLLGTLVTVIQAFVFTLLSMIYVALAVAHHEDEPDLL